MAEVVRLLTVVEVREDTADRTSFTALHTAVLDDGRSVVLLDDRGWTESPGGILSDDDVAESARTVVGPDEPFGAHSQADMEADHWNWLAARLREHGVEADGSALARLPHDVDLSQVRRRA